MMKLALLLAVAAPAAVAAAPASPDAGAPAVLAQAVQPEGETAPADDTEAGPETETAPSPETEAAPEAETAPPQAREAVPEAETPSSQETEAVPEAETAPSQETEAAPDTETAPSDETEAAPDTETPPADDGETVPEAETAPSGDTRAAPEAEAQPPGPAGEGGILRSESALPEPVRETWRALVEAARSGDIERLRAIIEDQPEPPMVAFDDVDDPIAHLRSLSGDAEGREVLAILLEVLEAGFLHVDEGTPQEMYLWPYFARHPIEELTAPQMVELFTLLTAGDYQDMLSYGAYIFFRVGIAPDGRWLFFVAGD